MRQLEPATRLAVRDVRTVAPASRAEHGGKAVGLARLARAFAVPPALAIGASVCARFLAEAGVDLDHVRAKDVRDALVSAPPTAVLDELSRALATVPAGDDGWAVRSSAVLEDLDDASFAGQYRTRLHVAPGATAVDAVRSCWASQYLPSVAQYAMARGRVVGTAPAMGVVVQQMLTPDLAGVCFTSGPTPATRDRMVVESVPGNGEALVSGRRTPWHIELDGAGRVVAQMAPHDGTPRPHDAQVALVAEAGRRAAALFGGPQDLEWALQGGVLYLLQARPVTALGAAVARPPRSVAAAAR